MNKIKYAAITLGAILIVLCGLHQSFGQEARPQVTVQGTVVSILTNNRVLVNCGKPTASIVFKKDVYGTVIVFGAGQQSKGSRFSQQCVADGSATEAALTYPAYTSIQ